MKIKTSKGIKEVNEVFSDLESFKNYVLKLDKNIRYDNETVKKEMESLMVKLQEQEGVVSLSLMRGWLVKNYSFKTKKWGELEYWIERGWTKENALIELIKRNKEIKQRNRLCEEYWVNKGYSKEEAINEISKQQQTSSKCVKTYHGKSKKMLIEKGYSVEDINRICLTPTNVDFWVNKGYNEIDAKNQITEIQINNSFKSIEKRKQRPELYSAITETQIGYWINKGYSEEESNVLLSKRQSTFTLEKCVQKYGEEIGRIKYKNRQIKWRKKLLDSGNLASGYSKISQELFDQIMKQYGNNLNKVYYATNNGEYYIRMKGSNFFQYDFTDLNKNKIIEFNGDMYHANPNIYLAEDCPNPFIKKLTAKEIWDKDEQKINIAKLRGFDVLIIWESEYKQNKQEIINKCVAFLNKR